MASIFSRIIAGEIPSYKVLETESAYAFLDINPVAIGHTLLVPKREVDYIFELSDSEYAELLLTAKRLSKAIKEAFPCLKVGMAVIGLDVPHAHIHLIPLQSASDMDFTKEKLKLSPEEFASIAKKISQAL